MWLLSFLFSIIFRLTYMYVNNFFYMLTIFGTFQRLNFLLRKFVHILRIFVLATEIISKTIFSASMILYSECVTNVCNTYIKIDCVIV